MRKTGLVALIFIICAVMACYGIYVSAAEKATGKETAKKEAPAKSDSKKEAAPAKSGEIAAKVNGQPIYKAEFQSEVDKFERQASMMGRGTDEKQVAEMRKQILDKLVGREILRQEAVRLGLKVNNDELESHIKGLREKMGTPEEFTQALSHMGLTEQTLKDQFASEMMLRRLIDQEIASKVTVETSEIKAFYEKNPDMFKTPEMVRASHILVKVDEKATPADKTKAMEKMKGIEKRIKAGEDFAAVAKEVSDCPSKEKGGDLDFFQRGQMVPQFEQVAFDLKPGKVSGIVETEFGYHLIKVTDHKDAGSMSFDEIKPRIEQYLKGEKISKQLADYVEKLKSSAKIEILAK